MYSEVIKNRAIVHYKYFLKSIRKVVLMDNVAFHKTKAVRDYIQTTKSIILFVPPYSPDYNPIEMVFFKAQGSIQVLRSGNERCCSISHRHYK